MTASIAKSDGRRNVATLFNGSLEKMVLDVVDELLGEFKKFFLASRKARDGFPSPALNSGIVSFSMRCGEAWRAAALGIESGITDTRITIQYQVFAKLPTRNGPCLVFPNLAVMHRRVETARRLSELGGTARMPRVPG